MPETHQLLPATVTVGQQPRTLGEWQRRGGVMAHPARLAPLVGRKLKSCIQFLCSMPSAGRDKQDNETPQKAGTSCA